MPRYPMPKNHLSQSHLSRRPLSRHLPSRNSPAIPRRDLLRLLSIAAVIPPLSAVLGGCESSTGDPVRDIENLLADRLADNANLTLGVVADGEVRYRGDFGSIDRERDLPATSRSVYDIGSVTKQFTAAAVLALEMDGALRVTDSVADHLPELNRTDVTIHHLLTHTSGLVDVLGADDDPVGRDDFIAEAAATPPTSPPGRYAYSNVGYSLLGAIIERATDLSYEEYLARRLFAPAAMTDTGYVLPQWDSRDIVVEYDERSRPHGRPNEQPWANDGPYWNLRANGGVLSTADDMCRWLLALDGTDILSEPMATKMFTPHTPEEDDSSWYGYGWVILEESGHRLAWHNGGNDRSYSEILRDLDTGTALFWSTNQVADIDAWDLAESDLTFELLTVLRRFGW
ncbi:CubicO group peptidase (beta-lactamase class C family) [Stackebrandtia endophytica]|uniref:CubicO group peptidase (Beta-lactamase class C family) n=1 Tax=Stackebrandtia endophytica TaxID=1496996 RepID=A0A543ATT6_9ACTN|nr:serine hydrolase domain-containing protein [Stackebrandtia endophytica]TQL75991.1 CubicO group peptidase (beta-lactamase class C family) [Stackebrandtia endophytica]